jgi:hypothetical protein
MIEVERPTGYSLLLPAGWVRIPLREGTQAAIAAVVERSQAEDREALSTRLHAMTAQLRDSGGLDLYLPTTPVGDFAIPASIIVAEVGFGAVEPLDPAMLVASLAAEDKAEPISVDGALGVRAGRTTPANPGRGAPSDSRRVEYVIPVPQDPDRWLTATFWVLTPDGADAETVELLIELFDAIMTTFRWS